jgi:hypothetical protein
MVVKFWRNAKPHNVGSFERPQRITNMTTSQLKEWLDVEIMNLGASFDQWRYHDSEADTITERLETTSMIWDEIMERNE